MLLMVGYKVRVLPAYAGMGPLAQPLVLPAYAGMIPALRKAWRKANSAPRVCGDDPLVFQLGVTAVSCSPRMRG